MPGAVSNAGLADKVLPLKELAPEILRRIQTGHQAIPFPPPPKSVE
jgi:chemotaxis response regulator CheB